MAKTRKRTESASVLDPSSSHSENTLEPAADYRDRVAMRAYELYLARGCADGGDFDDWLAAERELTGGAGNASRGDIGE